MITPKISVIVPVYKAEKYLHRCVDSILAQTFQDFEVILIDDGSPDKSGEICDEYAKKDSRVRVFHKENGGVSSARNLGLDNAKGEWVYFIDADDILYTDSLQTLFSKTTYEIDCIIGGYVTISDNREKRNDKAIIIDEVWDYKAALMDFYKSKYWGFNGYLWNRLFRLSIIRKAGLKFNEKIYFKEDGLFVVQFICCSKKNIYITTKPIYKYRINTEGAMQGLYTNFNIKYITNLDARILCWDNVKSVTKTKDFKLRFFARYSIVESYYMILNHMKNYNMSDEFLILKIYAKMKNSMSMPFLYILFLYRKLKYIITNNVILLLCQK